MYNTILALFLLLISNMLYMMDDPIPKKVKKDIPQIPYDIIPNSVPAINVTDESPLQKQHKLQRTFSELLKKSSSETQEQSYSQNNFAQTIPDTLEQPLLLRKPEKKQSPRKKLSLTIGSKSSSISESPSTSPKTSPRIKSSLTHKKLSTSSPRVSPRESKSSASSPREVTYDDVMNAFDAKSSKLKKIVKCFLENPDSNPNQKNVSGLTILQRTILLHHEEIADLLLSDPRTDIQIENNDARKAFDFIKDDKIKFKELLAKLHKREMIDLIIDALIITNKEMRNALCLHAVITHAICSFLEKTLPGILPTYAHQEFFFRAIRHRQTHKLSFLEDFYKKFEKNPNHQDLLGNTMWHYAAISLNKALLKELACNPYLDSSIRNKANNIAAQLIPSSNQIKTKDLTQPIIEKIQYLKDLRTFLFTREVLELSSSRQAQAIKDFTFLSGTQSSSIAINPEDLASAKKLMIQDFDDIAKNQGDSSLPASTQFPSYYATDDFIRDMLQRKMDLKNTQEIPAIKDTSHTILEKLLKVVAEESELILSGKVKLNHIVIEQKPDDNQPLVSRSSED